MFTKHSTKIGFALQQRKSFYLSTTQEKPSLATLSNDPLKPEEKSTLAPRFSDPRVLQRKASLTKTTNTYVFSVSQVNTTWVQHSNDLAIIQERSSVTMTTYSCAHLVPKGKSSLASRSCDLPVSQWSTFPFDLPVHMTYLAQGLFDFPISQGIKSSLTKNASGIPPSQEKASLNHNNTTPKTVTVCDCKCSKELKKKLNDIESEYLSMLDVIDQQDKALTELMNTNSNCVQETLKISKCNTVHIETGCFDDMKFQLENMRQLIEDVEGEMADNKKMMTSLISSIQEQVNTNEIGVTSSPVHLRILEVIRKIFKRLRRKARQTTEE